MEAEADRPSRAEREAIIDQIKSLTDLGVLPREQRNARIALARAARHRGDLLAITDPNHVLPEAGSTQPGARAVVLAMAVAVALLALGGVLFALLAAPA